MPDLIAPGLRVLFCGINPGLYSGAVGHHFARPGNRFWPVLFAAGFTDRLLTPYEERQLLDFGYGITNIVNMATAQASELMAAALQKGVRRLERNALAFRPGAVAVLGIDAYRKAFDRPRAMHGRQAEKIGDSILWVLPNPSGINASYQMADLFHLFAKLRSET